MHCDPQNGGKCFSDVQFCTNKPTATAPWGWERCVRLLGLERFTRPGRGARWTPPAGFPESVFGGEKPEHAGPRNGVASVRGAQLREQILDVPLDGLLPHSARGRDLLVL